MYDSSNKLLATTPSLPENNISQRKKDKATNQKQKTGRIQARKDSQGYLYIYAQLQPPSLNPLFIQHAMSALYELLMHAGMAARAPNDAVIYCLLVSIG